MSKALFIFLLSATALLATKAPSGLYNNGKKDAALFEEHLPYGIDMSQSKNGGCDQLLPNIAYVSCYSYKTNTPLWSSYTITAESVSGKSERPDTFFYDKRIPKKHRIKASDYTGSGYDRGHVCPNAVADGRDKIRQYQTFLMSNIAPQAPKLNRVGWRYIEEAVRKWTKRGTLNVVTGVLFDDNPKKFHRRKQHWIAVPDYWYKIIYNPNREKAIAFIMRNKPVAKNEWIRYRVSIDTIEQMTGIDFFPFLPDEVEDRVEADVSGKF